MCSSVDVALIGLEEGLKSHPPNDQKQSQNQKPIAFVFLKTSIEEEKQIKDFHKNSRRIKNEFSIEWHMVLH